MADGEEEIPRELLLGRSQRFAPGASAAKTAARKAAKVTPTALVASSRWRFIVTSLICMCMRCASPEYRVHSVCGTNVGTKVAQRKSFAELLADMNKSIDASLQPTADISITGAADGVPLSAPRITKRKVGQQKPKAKQELKKQKTSGVGQAAAPESTAVPKKTERNKSVKQVCAPYSSLSELLQYPFSH